MDRISVQRRIALGIGAGALLAGTLAGPAFAVDTVTQVITAGALTASVETLALPSVVYNNAAHNVTGTMVLTAEDSRGTSLGWSVTIVASDFVWVGTPTGGTDIPAANFALTSAGDPTVIDGQAVSLIAANGPQVPPTSPLGTLDSARKTMMATAAFGNGKYSQDLGVTLTIPAQSHAGTYTGTLTTTISATP